MARVRSPNYPSISLPAAIERVRVIHKSEGQNNVPREVIATHLGFGSINGASATLMSALGKYGLIESVGGGEARVSDIALRILFPHDNEEKVSAMREAALRPSLFSEIKEKWPDRAPSEESLRSHLVRNGFSQGALDQVIQVYRETVESINLWQQEGVEAYQNDIPSPVAQSEQKLPIPSVSAALESKVSDKPFSLSFDGTVLEGVIALKTVKDIDRLIKVLHAQRAAMIAMQDDDE